MPVFAQAQAPAVITAESRRIKIPYGVQAGDIRGDRAMIWSRADRAGRMIVELSTTESFKESWTIDGPAALEDTDYTARLDVAGLPPGQRIFYRVRFLDLGDLKTLSEPATGSFATRARHAPEHPPRLVGRRLGPGLGHQSRLRRHAHLRGDAQGAARLLHPFRRHDLRRRPDPRPR